MFYGEINPGDVLEWKTFGGQSTKILIIKEGEIVTYGNAKGKDKKIRPAFYIRALHAFDDEPQLVDAATLKQNCKRVEGDAAAAPDNDSPIDDFGAPETEVFYDEFSQAEPQARQTYSQDEPERAPEKPKKALTETRPYR